MEWVLEGKPGAPGSVLVLLASKYAGVSIEVVAPRRAHNALRLTGSRCPEGVEGASAAAKFLSRRSGHSSLLGASPFETAKIEEWFELIEKEVNPLLTAPSIGGEVLNYINNHLRSHTFLVSERVTLADLSLYTKLSASSVQIQDYISLVRWHSLMSVQPIIQAFGAISPPSTTTSKVTTKPSKANKKETRNKNTNEARQAAVPSQIPAEVIAAGNKVRELKAAKADSATIKAAVAQLLALKEKHGLAPLTKSKASSTKSNKGRQSKGSKKPIVVTTTTTTTTTKTAKSSPKDTGLKLVKSKMRIHSWSKLVMDQRLYFQFIFMDASLFVWIGNKSARMGELCFGLQTPFDNIPSATALMGPQDGFSLSFSQKLASRSGMSVLVSLNIPQANSVGGRDPLIEAVVEREVFKELASQLCDDFKK